MTKTEFLLTISKQYQEHKWWELRKISIIGLLIDPVPNSPNKYDDNCLADSRRITGEILGVKGLKNYREVTYLVLNHNRYILKIRLKQQWQLVNQSIN